MWYQVWREEDSSENARRVKATSAEHAATRWAEWIDSWGADYSIVGGQSARIFVALDEHGAEPELFEVYGESTPIYTANPVSTE